MDLLQDLTPAQRDAVTHHEGPLLVLAGPGSGKTRVITRRIAHMLRSGIKPWNILAITFTNKAAGEMRKRVDEVVPKNRVIISTFHSLGVRLLRQYASTLGMEPNFTIYDMGDRNALIKESMKQAQVDPDGSHTTPDRVQAAISRAKNELKGPEAFASNARDFFDEKVSRVYPIYEKKLRAANGMDFDDLLFWLAYLLRKYPEVRTELDARFKYVMIDEYQDTNYAQYVIAKQLSMDFPNLCVVGDPDQSIYRFRGSDIRNILDFERDYPQARTITLDQNYRSTKSILAAADSLIAHNRSRKPKKLVTQNAAGDRIKLLNFASGLDEAYGIAKIIRELVDTQDIKFKHCAIFLRMNALSRVLETAFIKQRIPYQIVRGLAFFDRKENKDVLAYLRLLVNPMDTISFRRAVNVPARGVGDTSMQKLEDFALPREISLLSAAQKMEQIPEIKGKAAKGLRDFAALMQGLQPMLETSAGEAIREVINRSGYRAMLAAGTGEDLERLENIEELITAADEFDAELAQRTEGEIGKQAGASSNLAAFLEHITLRSDQDAHDASADQVSIMTMHAAKGLEFPVVFMPAFEMGILPHERSANNQDELEEERRLAFVGITRAERHLFISHADYREFRGSQMCAIPSPFLDELPEDVLEKQRVASDLDRFDPRHEENYRYDRPSFRQAPVMTRSVPKPTFASLKTGAELAGLTAPPAGPKDLNAFVVGATVKHGVYGLGKIQEVSGLGAGKRVKIRFGSGEKTFIAEKAPLEVVPKP
ncbi:MAG: UvrD-helicase domain-containing protein [Planctomycetia bacterium]|nr:UvrD-helicase domain-containing protein [Planctomycetia bacterium]